MPSISINPSGQPSPWLPLLIDLLDQGLDVSIRISGDSMAPGLHGGDKVTLGRLQGRPQRGDLLLFRNRHDNLVLHRLVRFRSVAEGEPLLQTRGDALNRLDDAVAVDAVLGRVSRIQRIDGSQLDLDGQTARWRAWAYALWRWLDAGLRYKWQRLRGALGTIQQAR